MMYAVVTYANMRGIRSVDRIVDLCERDLAFIWLTRGQKPKRDAFYDFKNRKLTSDVLDDLNYQFMRRLQKEGLVTLKELFIDGTKIEANAKHFTTHKPYYAIRKELLSMDYQLELKQIVDFPRCRIYREFIQTLIKDRNIRTNGSSCLFYFLILCSYAN